MDDVGGGADSNAVHYNAADGKTAIEKLQARINIGSTSQPEQFESITGNINDLAVTSNFIVLSGGDKVLTGILAQPQGTEIIIYNLGGTLTFSGNNGLSATLNQIQAQYTGQVIPSFGSVILKYRINRWQLFDFGRYVPAFGNFRKEGTLFIKGVASASILILETSAGVQVFKFDQNELTVNARMIVNSNGQIYKATSAGASIASFKQSSGTDVIEIRSDRLNAVNTTIDHSRSTSSIKSIRRDEQRLHYLLSITTSGSINDQALTAGIFNYRFTAATNITGLANGEIGRRITIQNDNTVDLIIEHEDVLSIAANRFNLIGAVDITIPTKGKADFEYCTGSRWELISKNF